MKVLHKARAKVCAVRQRQNNGPIDTLLHGGPFGNGGWSREIGLAAESKFSVAIRIQHADELQ